VDSFSTGWWDAIHYLLIDNDNDNDKRLGLTTKADQPDHKKYNTPKIKMNNEALLLLVCVSFTIIGQPRNSVLIRRV